MHQKFRLRVLTKLAQMEPPSNLPTDEVAAEKPVSGSPPSFVATDMYPGIITAFGKNATWINELANILNQALYYTSNGQVNLQWMKANNFNFGTSNVPSVDLKNLMGFSKQVYNHLFTNNGENDKKALTSEELVKRTAPLRTSSFIADLSSTNPMGTLSSKLGGNVKTKINDTLLKIK